MTTQTPEKPFYLDEYLYGYRKPTEVRTDSQATNMDRFLELCELIRNYFRKEWEESQGKSYESDSLLETQKRAIIGYQQEVNYFKSRINEFLKNSNLLNHWKPDWYTDLISAVFHENWGFGGIDEWRRMPKSQSCKVIGRRIYFMVDGRMELQEQTMSPERVSLLLRALLLRTPEKRMERGTAEVYMLDGTRIKIYLEGVLTKETVIVFRKVTVEQFTFEEQARLGTIPSESIPLFRSMVACGYNVNFIGAVRSGKTTFLTTWQVCEDPSLEGLSIETDPEIPLHVIMPRAPIVQMVADGDMLRYLGKEVLRSDADYIIMAEARDGVALKIAVTVTGKGTRRVKSTFHTSVAADFCYDAATEIVQEFGGDIFAYTIKVARSFHYLFEFIQLSDKRLKRLKGIHELRYDPISMKITTHQICRYDVTTDSWTFKHDIGLDKREIGMFENPQAFENFDLQLRRLAERYPMQGEHVTELPYFKHLMR